MKKLFITMMLITIPLFIGCNNNKDIVQWEYIVKQFDRENEEMMSVELAKLGNFGWEYAGPLANNGINAQYVAFKRIRINEFSKDHIDSLNNDLDSYITSLQDTKDWIKILLSSDRIPEDEIIDEMSETKRLLELKLNETRK